jgi:hypothetical protein
MAERIGRLLEAPPGRARLDDLLGRSIAYLIAVGPRAGQKLFALQVRRPSRPNWKAARTAPPWRLLSESDLVFFKLNQ